MSRLALEPHERRKLMVGNAERLLKLSFTGAPARR
jgi:hypothetical protein